jgi:carbon monoxide dehydrogenase subunit G
VKIEGQHNIAAAPDAVWAGLNDPAILAKSLPGVDNLEADGPDRYKAAIKYKMGPVGGSFNGTVEFSDKKPPQSMHFKIGARGGPGFANGEGQVELAGKGNETELRYSADFQVGGMLAAVGQRMIEGASRKAIDDFFQAFAKALAEKG